MESAVHQVASASVAAIFSIGMFFAAHLFTEYRSSRAPAITIVQPSAELLQAGPRLSGGRADDGSFSVSWRNGAI